MSGAELRQWRHEQGWTLDQAARFLGTTRTSVHRWEAGTKDARGIPSRVPVIIAILAHLLKEQRNRRAVETFLYRPLDS